jgi:nucleotide-binding universal stress UspA family protein
MTMFKKILVPVDGSATSERGLQQAIRFAKSQNATLIVLHVVDENVVTQSALGGGYFIEGLLEGLLENGKKVLAKAEAAVRKQGVKVLPVLIEDIGLPVSEVIVGQAKKLRADVIVLGTHGRRGISRLLMGSDAEGVVRMAPVPVLLVRSPAPASRKKK